jgi:hypothetical protein
MKIAGIILGIIACLIAVAVMYIGTVSPETHIYTGRQVPKKYMSTIGELKLLQKDEQIRYFYSDAILDIKAGFYFVTGRNLVIYSSEWEEPAEVMPLKEITKLEVEYDDSFFEDSMVYIETMQGLEISFPLSSEKGMDRKFVEAIREKMPQQVEEPGRAPL